MGGDTCGRSDMTKLVTPYDNAPNTVHEYPIRLSPRPEANSDVPHPQLKATKIVRWLKSTYFFVPLLGLFHAFCCLKTVGPLLISLYLSHPTRINKTPTMEGAKICIGNNAQSPKVKEIAFRRTQDSNLPGIENNLAHRQNTERQTEPTI